jgi:hypothetical protein
MLYNYLSSLLDDLTKSEKYPAWHNLVILSVRAGTALD